MDRASPTSVTDREAEVLAHLAAGRSNAQIAHVLHISVRTVENHVSSLLRKLGAGDRHELAALAGPRTSEPGGVELAGLPSGRGTFVGRQQDRLAVLGSLDDHRLVSVVGPGGMGKTRLAAVVAAETARGFPAGAAFVDLVPVRRGLVADAVANALGVSERPGQDLTRTIAGALGAGRFLLVLDNCEHVIDDVGALIGSLLDQCPHLAVLATTRQRLGLPDERVVQLGPLPADPDGVRLFLDRARAGDPDLELDRAVVAGICDHLDGMPLAIEIAAARAASLGQDGLRAAIGDQVRLLSGARGVAARHASLDAVMGWSYDLLDDEERAMLRGLSVFAGSFDLASVASVAGAPDPIAAADLLGRLVDNSLVVRATSSGHTRWRLLETVRAFADTRISEAERADLTARHLRWAIATAIRLQDSLEETWAREFDAVVDDLRDALARSPATPDEASRGLARALAHLTFARGYHREAREHYLAAAARSADSREAFADIRDGADVAIAGSDSPGGVELLLLAARRVGDSGNDAARAWASAVENQIRFGYEYGPAGTPEQRSDLLEAALREADPSDKVATALISTARAWHEGGVDRTDLARTAVAQARASGDPIVTLRALDVLSATLSTTGRLREALEVAHDRLDLLDGLPRHRPAAAVEISDTFQVAIKIAVATGELAVASDILERAEVEDPTPNPYAAIPRRISVGVLTGRFAAAIEQGEELWEAWQRDGTDRRWLAPAFNLTALAHALSDDGLYDEWRARTSIVALADSAPTEWMAAHEAFVEIRAALHTGDFAEAPTLVDDAFASSPGWEGHSESYARAAGAELAVAAGMVDAEERITAAEPHAAENRWAAATLARARGRLLGRQEELEAAATTYALIGAEFERAYTIRLMAGERRPG
ncbi:MAG TPA: LuxR C-terminal-related transcriptional regulator [Nocardioides sp.]|nr:LuxR C-terminal-related transcriptional regulator [Nocardioides sp.]